MAKTKTTDFSKQRNILNFRPDIHYVEPPQVEEEKPQVPTVVTLDQVKSDLDNMIGQYADIADTADGIQAAIDQSAKDVVVNLDPNVDGPVIEAVQRHFGDPNKTSITYGEYMDCLKEINEQGAANAPAVEEQDIINAASDPYRDMFGSLGLPPGLGRPELFEESRAVKPINLKKFQIELIEKLLEKMTPGIQKIVLDKIKEKVGL